MARQGLLWTYAISSEASPNLPQCLPWAWARALPMSERRNSSNALRISGPDSWLLFTVLTRLSFGAARQDTDRDTDAQTATVTLP